MSRFKEEFSIISRNGKIVAFLVFLALIVGLNAVIELGMKPGGPPTWFRVYISLIVPVPVTAFALVIAYIHADGKRRGMRHVMWTWLSVLIPNGIGVILYFILREPLLRLCDGCGTKVKQTFTFCPSCGAALQPACPACRKAVEPQWSNCPYCGGRLAA